MTRFERQSRRSQERHAVVLVRAQGCTCTASLSWHQAIVGDRCGKAIRIGHALDCPRLAELRTLAGEAPLPHDIVTANLLRGGER